MFYWFLILLILGGILVAFFIYNYYNRVSADSKSLESIRTKWGKPLDTRRNFTLIAAYLNASESAQRISQATIEDLDLVNIFNYIDRTNSKPGKQYLYKKLFTPDTSLDSLLKFDKKVAALNMPRPDVESIELELSRLNSTDAYFIIELFLKEHLPLVAPALGIYIRISALAIIALIVSLAFIPNLVSLVLLVALFIANILLHYSTKNRLSFYARSLPQLLILKRVAGKLLNKIHFDDDEPVKFSVDNLSGLNRSLNLVSFESKLADHPGNFRYVLYKGIKLLFLLEPLMFITSVSRVNKYRGDIENIYRYVAEIDAMIAVLSVRAGLPYYSKPVFCAADEPMELTEMYHPLIHSCVPNSIRTRTDEGVLITGSNMSGKTTFIRSIAVNTLLAQTIYTSCSKVYKAPLLKIQTSVKTSDNLEGNTSYFQAEAISILDIINKSGAKEPVKSLIIIDEIFRGTNTIERIAAAKSVLTWLTDNKNFVFVSTHDLELAELLDNEYAVYSFEETVIDTRLVFDYKMKTGILKKNNGIATLASIGYPDSVVEDAYIVSEGLKRRYLL